jgi:hypothetical protein
MAEVAAEAAETVMVVWDAGWDEGVDALGEAEGEGSGGCVCCGG